MSLTYSLGYSSSSPSAFTRALYVWLLSNLGGTGWLAMDFGLKYADDLVVPLAIGLIVALISLACVPFTGLFFSLAHRTCTSWRCRLVAMSGVSLAFALANIILMQGLPIGPLDSLLSLSKSYLGAAMLALVWLYGPAVARRPPATIPLPQSLTVIRSKAGRRCKTGFSGRPCVWLSHALTPPVV